MDWLQEFFKSLIDQIPPLNDESSQSLNIFVFFVQWSAIILYALSGFHSARKYGMDIYGCLAISLILAVGGGTVRDLLLGRYPIFWLSSPTYVITVAVLGCILLVFPLPVEQIGHKESKWQMIYLIIDSLGLGLWAYLGTLYALEMNVQPIVAPIMGSITASFGGVLCDVFFLRTPKAFMPGKIFVSAATIGSIVYAFMWWLGVAEIVSFTVCLLITFVVRIISAKYNIQSPPLNTGNLRKKE